MSWSNTFHNKKRTLAAMAGIAFSILLIFMQIGFLNGGRLGGSLLYHYVDFDLAMVSDKFLNFGSPDEFPKTRLMQALAIDGVKDVFVLNIAPGTWTDIETETDTYMHLLGFDLKPEFILNKDISRGLGVLKTANTVIVDALSHEDYGDLSIGTKAKINGKQVTIGEQFKLGMFFLADGWALADNTNFTRLTYRDPNFINFGLVSVSDRNKFKEIKAELENNLPDDIVFITRKELIKREQDYFIEVKPVGIIFRFGVLVSYLIGVVILFQILYTDISTRFREYATLKALGFSRSYLYSIGFYQALLMISLSYIPAISLTFILFRIIYKLSNLPMKLTPQLALFVLLLSLTMGVVSSIIAFQKVGKADPAELF